MKKSLKEKVEIELDKIIRPHSGLTVSLRGHILIRSLKLSAYIRYTSRWISNKVIPMPTPNHMNGTLFPSIEIGSVSVDEKHQGKGNFKKFIQVFEEIAQEKGRVVFVESVLDERFQDFWQRRGYTQIDKLDPPSFVKRFSHAKENGEKVKQA